LCADLHLAEESVVRPGIVGPLTYHDTEIVDSAGATECCAVMETLALTMLSATDVATSNNVPFLDPLGNEGGDAGAV
jgi:hypothetical protein